MQHSKLEDYNHKIKQAHPIRQWLINEKVTVKRLSEAIGYNKYHLSEMLLLKRPMLEKTKIAISNFIKDFEKRKKRNAQKRRIKRSYASSLQSSSVNEARDI